MKYGVKQIRRLLRIVFGRTSWVLLFFLIQVGILLAAFQWLGNHIIYVFGGFTLLSAITVIYILNKDEDSSFKMAWVIPVLVIPVFGTLFYLFVELQPGARRMNRRLTGLIRDTEGYIPQDEQVLKQLRQQEEGEANLASYMKQYGGFPVYGNTRVTYFPLGEDKFEELKKQLKQAKHFIFMEYFIVERGLMWNSLLEILEQKVKEGVEVRVMYDGMCCLNLLPYRYPKELEEKGIRCKMFSPIVPALSTIQNNRDHRKITVIDGHTAFTGGINLADEYINQKERFGHWKDTAIMLQGDAARNFTVMFLQMWNITESKPEPYKKYLTIDGKPRQDSGQVTESSDLGYVMPYGDSPIDNETVGEYVYLDILNRARRYVHIMTPYLILDQDMNTSMKYAAKKGVEVVIIMPHVPDKLLAYLLARSYYQELLEAGVQIYEYTPGFVHAKVFTSDDEKAVVGTINLDFRSLYLNFECAAYLYQNPAVHDIERDYQNVLAKCQKITLEDCKRYPFGRRALGSLLRLFAPLM